MCAYNRINFIDTHSKHSKIDRHGNSLLLGYTERAKTTAVALMLVRRLMLIGL